MSPALMLHIKNHPFKCIESELEFQAIRAKGTGWKRQNVNSCLPKIKFADANHIEMHVLQKGFPKQSELANR